MTLDRAARLTGYLTLALAAACLAWADAQYVPLLPALWLPALALLVLAFLVEERGWVMPVWASNVAGLLIAAGVVAGVVVLLFRGADDDMPLALAVLPYVGPVIVLLALVKAFGPKQEGDLWAIQGLGLLAVGLGCALTDRNPFGALLLAYLVCCSWHLALAYLRREERRAAGPAAAPGRVPWRVLGTARAARWSLAAGLLALPAFLAAPRLGEEPWDPLIFAGPNAPHRPMQLRTGPAVGLDLNRTGTLDPSDEVVLRVEAFADEARTVPKTDLPPGQRWRGATLDYYENGRWRTTPLPRIGAVGVGVGKGAPQPAQAARRLPDLGPGQFYLDFTVVLKTAGSFVLAEPAVIRGDVLPVIRTHAGEQTRPPFQAGIAAIVPAPLPGERGEVRYRQVVPAAADPDLSDPVTADPNYATQQPVSALMSWSRDLALRLAAGPGSGLTAADVESVATPDGRREPREPERVARAVTAYLASSGEYSYSFEQERSDLAIDPTYDFLVNVKSGPCTRFATGLALVLRSLGVPARVVLGFRGCQSGGDGRYEILASQSHAWVEALVSRPGPDGAPQAHWLVLDPTPSSEDVPRPPFSLARWWELHKIDGLALWRNYVVDYKPGDLEGDLPAALAELFGHAGEFVRGSPAGGAAVGLASVLAVVGAGAAYRRRKRRAAAARGRARVPFYARLLDVLARVHGLGPRAAQTPREFAAEAGHALRARDRAAVADVPARVAELFYRVAYGGRPLTDDEAREIERRLDALAAAR
jgi:hypothetical protein